MSQCPFVFGGFYDLRNHSPYSGVERGGGEMDRGLETGSCSNRPRLQPSRLKIEDAEADKIAQEWDGEKENETKAESLEEENQLQEEKLWQLGGVGPRPSNEEGASLDRVWSPAGGRPVVGQSLQSTRPASVFMSRIKVHFLHDAIFGKPRSCRCNRLPYAKLSLGRVQNTNDAKSSPELGVHEL